MKVENPIDQYFRQHLSKHTSKPDPRLWAGIAARSEAASPRYFARWRLAAALLIALAMGSAALYFWRPTQLTPGAMENRDEPKRTTETTPLPSLTANPEPSQKDYQPTPKTAARSQTAVKESLSAPVAELSWAEEQSLNREHDEQMALEASELLLPEDKYRVRVYIPQHLYAQSDAAASAGTRHLDRNLLAYADEQWQRLRRGEKLRWPQLAKEPALVIPLPKVINAQ